MYQTSKGAVPIAGLWRKRKALRWADGHEDLQGPLDVQRYNWSSASSSGRDAIDAVFAPHS